MMLLSVPVELFKIKRTKPIKAGKYSDGTNEQQAVNTKLNLKYVYIF